MKPPPPPPQIRRWHIEEWKIVKVNTKRFWGWSVLFSLEIISFNVCGQKNNYYLLKVRRMQCNERRKAIFFHFWFKEQSFQLLKELSCFIKGKFFVVFPIFASSTIRKAKVKKKKKKKCRSPIYAWNAMWFIFPSSFGLLINICRTAFMDRFTYEKVVNVHRCNKVNEGSTFVIIVYLKLNIFSHHPCNTFTFDRSGAFIKIRTFTIFLFFQFDHKRKEVRLDHKHIDFSL